MTDPHPVEIELKLALPPHQVEPFLKLMARRRCEPVRSKLITRYFDTPGFGLSAQGIALRVRKIGRRWLQTLKTEGERQGGLSKRAEYEMAVSGDMPDWARFPAAAQVMVPDALREQLVPVFETRFTRTTWLVGGSGGAKIEVALDMGEVFTLKGIKAGQRSQPICEIELELKAGKPDALFTLAQGWAQKLDCLPWDVSKAERGVRLARGQASAPVKSAPLGLHKGMAVEKGFAAMVQACLTQFLANLPGVLDSDDIEYVHQARVALRRLRVALRLYRKVCELPDALQDGLHALDQAMGPVRDWDVLCGEILPSIAPYFADEEAWQFGLDVVEARRAEVRATMRDAVRQMRPGAWLLAFQLWLLQQGWRQVSDEQRLLQLAPLKTWARRALKKDLRKLDRGVRKLKQDSPAQRHALRIAVKRQRYTVEFFQSLFVGRKQDEYLAAMRKLQAEMGRMNDADVVSRLILEPTVEMGAMRPFVMGWLAAQQAKASKNEIDNKLKNFIKSAPGW